MSLTKKEIVVETFSKKTYGIKGENSWYNKAKNVMTDDAEADVVAMIDQIAKGDKVSLEIDEANQYYSITLIEKGKEKSNWDDMTNFEDLLNDAHKNHKLGDITTEMISVDFDKKTAVFKATVTGEDDDGKTAHVFQAHGDATQENIDSDKVKVHWIRMAETRAISRALRWLTNNAKVAEEETGGKVLDKPLKNLDGTVFDVETKDEITQKKENKQ